MSNAKTGLWSAFGALLGGFVGAVSGKYVEEYRPRRGESRYGRGSSVEDAMVVGGATGAVLGAAIAGGLAGEAPAPQQLPPPK